MALINVLKIGADGLQAEHDPSTDSVSLLDVTLNGTPLNSGTGGVDVISDDAAAYSNISPAGNTLQDTLNAIDSLLGTTVTNECLVSDSFTNGEVSAITLGQAVYLSGNDEVKLADNDNSAADDPVGVVGEASIAASAQGKVITHGCVLGALSGATAGTKYFLDATPGALTTTAPVGSGKNVVLMGFAMNATDLYLRVQNIGKRA